jgi:hypothetical protein
VRRELTHLVGEDGAGVPDHVQRYFRQVARGLELEVVLIQVDLRFVDEKLQRHA